MSLIDRCHDPYGKLSPRRRGQLNRLLQSPDRHLWERSRGLVIRATPLVTLEMAVRSVSRRPLADAPPDPFTLYRALHFAVG
ncbi:MAG TPA: hypothetical protein ENK12_00875 [Gammaproteobacteria bacterium]|nr:hypothetical protein [Gammaproteobacteria bacterium]